MASNFESSIHRGSDLFCDFPCFTCQENDRNTQSEFYCEECSKFFCDKCMEHHNYLFKKHATLGKENISQWPFPNADDLEKCQKHKKEKLTGFCEDHSELICHVCHVYNHQKCSHVLLIADKVKNLQQNGEFKQFQMTIDTIHQQLMQKKDDFEENLKSLEKSYDTILEQINCERKSINDSLDHIERNTIKEMDTLRATMRTSIKTDIDHCTESINNIKCVQDEWLRRKEKSEAIHLIMYRRCRDQSLKTEVALQEMKTKNAILLTLNADPTIQRLLSNFTELGLVLRNKFTLESESSLDVSEAFKPDQYIKVTSRRTSRVSTEHDVSICFITGICETATGELLIADWGNEMVKLLNQDYKVVAHCALPGKPESMCSIDSSLVAVVLNTSDIHFIKVTNGQAVQEGTLKLQHNCKGITHHQGNLYITSGTALYQYTVDGRFVSKIFENTSDGRKETVTSCAVSPDGERIYVAYQAFQKLVTLSRDGKVISTLTDPTWNESPFRIHVTDSGQVLVCGKKSNTIIQVGRDGKKRLAKVVTKEDGVYKPCSVYYSKYTEQMVVGMWDSDEIIVFETEFQDSCTLL